MEKSAITKMCVRVVEWLIQRLQSTFLDENDKNYKNSAKTGVVVRLTQRPN